jgi:glutamine amidotransferase-like uncharacterized protein
MITRRIFSVLVLCIAVITPQFVYAGAPVWVAIYDHSAPGVANGPKNLQRFLTADKGFRAVVVSPEEIKAGRLSAFDVLIMPGGSGSKQAKMLGEDGRAQVKEFITRGGGYVGICAGSYLASSDYDWSLHIINAKVQDRAHWARGTGEVTLKFSGEGQKELKHDDEKINVYYCQGPLLVPDTKEDLPAFETLATYETEIAEKGAPKGVMIGTSAIARTTFGQGRVICYSPHPESASTTDHIMSSGILWACKRDQEILQPEATAVPEKTDAKKSAGDKSSSKKADKKDKDEEMIPPAKKSDETKSTDGEN